MRAREVVVDLVALDRELDPDRDQALLTGRVEVHVVLGLPGAVGQLGDALAGEPLDVVLHLGERRHDRVAAVLLDQAQDLPLRHPRRLRLGVQVALGVARRPRVGDDHADDVAEVAALVPDAHRRDAEALVEVLLRVDVEGAGNAAADVGPVAVGQRVRDELALVEDRADDAHVVEVRAAQVGVVHREDVARVHVVAERVDDRLAV